MEVERSPDDIFNGEVCSVMSSTLRFRDRKRRKTTQFARGWRIWASVSRLAEEMQDCTRTRFDSVHYRYVTLMLITSVRSCTTVLKTCCCSKLRLCIGEVRQLFGRILNASKGRDEADASVHAGLTGEGVYDLGMTWATSWQLLKPTSTSAIRCHGPKIGSHTEVSKSNCSRSSTSYRRRSVFRDKAVNYYADLRECCEGLLLYNRQTTRLVL